MKINKVLAMIVVALGTLKGCSGTGLKYLPYVNCNSGECFFDERSYDHDQDDDDCEWYLWPIDCY